MNRFSHLRSMVTSPLLVYGCLLASWSPLGASAAPVPMTTPVKADRLQVYTDAEDALRAKRELIQNAKSAVDLIYYIVEIDHSSALLFTDLLKKVKEVPGFKARLLVDYWQSQPWLAFLDYLVANGVEVKRYGAPDDAFLKTIDKLQIPREEFVLALIQSKPDLALAALQKSPFFQKLFALKAELAPGANRTSLDFIALLHRSVDLSNGSKDVLRLLAGIRRFVHWTHFKLTLSDHRCFVLGGRNLSDQYHVRRDGPLLKDKPYAFNDVDVRGCETEGASNQQSFDKLWNSNRSRELSYRRYPTGANVAPVTDTEVAKLVQAAGSVASMQYSPKVIDVAGPVNAELAVNSPIASSVNSQILPTYLRRIKDLKPGEELNIVNAYFFVDDEWPAYIDGGKHSQAILKDLHDTLIAQAHAGVRVNIYTNSYETTDLNAVNVNAYPKYRSLIEGGRGADGAANLHIYELAKGQGSLHMKAATFGKRGMAVGAFNMNPHSHLYDTNNVLFFDLAPTTSVVDTYLQQVKELQWNEVNQARLTEIQAILDKQSPTYLKALRGLKELF